MCQRWVWEVPACLGLPSLHRNWHHTCHLGSLPSQDICRLLLISLPRASGIQPHWSLCKVLASVQLGAAPLFAYLPAWFCLTRRGTPSAGSRLSFVKVLPSPSESVAVFSSDRIHIAEVQWLLVHSQSCVIITSASFQNDFGVPDKLHAHPRPTVDTHGIKACHQ